MNAPKLHLPTGLQNQTGGLGKALVHKFNNLSAPGVNYQSNWAVLPPKRIRSVKINKKEIPLKKMIKSQLISKINELQGAYDSNTESLRHARKSTDAINLAHKKEKAKLQDKLDKAIGAVEVWKSASIEATDHVEDLEAKLLSIREYITSNLLSFEQYPDDIPEEIRTEFLDKIMLGAANLIVSLDGKLTDLLQSCLPLPYALNIIKAFREHASRNDKGERQSDAWLPGC